MRLRFSSKRARRAGLTAAALAWCFSAARAQETAGNATAERSVKPAESGAAEAAIPQDKRIFGVLPNYRTTEESLAFQPIGARRKMAIAAKDSFDWPGYALAAAFAGLSQAEDQNHSFGQGLKGYSKRFAGAFGDQAIGNLLTEGVLPSALHEDPRYFRRGQGPKWERFRYAATRILVTRTDSGGRRFNFSEVGGNALSVGLSNAYYADTRNVGDNVQKFGVQLATDAASNVLKEFWPDFKRRFLKRGRS